MTLLLVAALALAPQAAQENRGTVRGAVVDREQGRPLADASIELRPAAGTQPSRITASDVNGAFVFSRVDAGNYRLIVRRSGYVTMEYGQQGVSGQGVEFAVAAGQQWTAARLSLIPTGVISGRITDARGKPVGNARVQAYRASYPDGRRLLAPVKEVLSDDLGMYRLFWLPPGQYFVSARVPDGPMGVTLLMNPDGVDNRGLYDARAQIGTVATTPVGSGAGENEVHIPVFYPGTGSGLAASPIDVAPGADVRGADINASPVRVWRVRGNVSGAGQPANGQVRLLAMAGSPATDYQTAIDASTGNFEFAKVAPGDYTALATIGGPNGLRAISNIEIRDRNIDDLALTLSAGISVPVQITADRSAGNIEFARLRVTLRPEPFLNGLPSPAATPSAAGAAALPGVLPGNYRLYVSPLLVPQNAAAPPVAPALANVYVKYARYGETDILTSGLRFNGAAGLAIEIALGANPGKLSGSVERAVSGITVALVPDEGRGFRTDSYKNTLTDPQGRFELSGIPPGRYRLFAWEDVSAGAWMDPGFLRRFEDSGTPVIVGEGSAIAVERPLPIAR
jgi:hypothetical protein